jgi:mono/diheme cytochrome c family protein
LRPLTAAAALTLLLCSCGGHKQAHPALQQRGRTVFADACSSCHTLTGHDSRAPGGDLAIARLSTREVASFVRVMPVHLSAADAYAVATYVHESMAARSGH